MLRSKQRRPSGTPAAVFVLMLAAVSASCVSIVDTPPPLKLLGPWTSITGSLITASSTCQTVLVFAARPDQDELIAGLTGGGFFALPAGASDWQALGTGSGSAPIANDAYSIVFDPDNPGVFWETGIHSPQGIYKTNDAGDTFVEQGNAANNDLIAPDFTDPLRTTQLAGVHESGTHVLLSTDAGATWTDIGGNLPAGSGDTSWPVVFDANTFLIGSNNGTNPGIFRSSDRGATWTQVSTSPVHSHPVRAMDGSIYWMVENTGGVVVSIDQGKTWSAPLYAGFIQAVVPGIVELPDGRLIAPGTRYLLISSDKAQTWSPISDLPFQPFGVAYSAARKSLYLWHSTCGTTGDVGSTDAIVALPFDFETQ